MSYFDNRKIVRALAILLLLNLAAISTMLYLFYSHPSATPPDAECKHRNKIEEIVGFDEQQSLAFNQLRKQHRENSKEIRRKISRLAVQIKFEITSTNPDSLRIEQLSEEMGELHARMQAMLAWHLIDVRAICKAEQLHKFDSTVSTIISRGHRKGIHHGLQTKRDTTDIRTENKFKK